MYRINDRIAIYYWLKEIGACAAARLVFYDNPHEISYDRWYFCWQDHSNMAFAVFMRALEYLEGEALVDFALDSLLQIADDWSWRQNETVRKHYRHLRYPPHIRYAGPYPFDDLPF